MWQDIGSPAPIENILARFTSIISDAKTVITNLDDPPVEAAPLPPDRIPYGFVDIGHENFTNDDVVAAHVTISVEREWLDTNQVHEWSMQFSRFEESTTSWVPTRSKRVRQDDDKVYFSVTVPGFSLWAVHGATGAPVVTFVEDNLRISPQSISSVGEATVSVDVTNRSNSSATYFASLWVERQISYTDEFVIGAGETRTVELPLSVDRVGEYEVRVGRQISRQPLVVTAPAPTPTPVPIPHPPRCLLQRLFRPQRRYRPPLLRSLLQYRDPARRPHPLPPGFRFPRQLRSQLSRPARLPRSYSRSPHPSLSPPALCRR